MFDSWILINRSQMHSLDISPAVCRWAMTSAWSQPLLRWTVMRTAAGLLPQTRWSWPKTRVRLSPTLLLWRTPKLQFFVDASWNEDEDLCGMRVLDIVLVLNELTGYFERLVICYFFLVLLCLFFYESSWIEFSVQESSPVLVKFSSLLTGWIFRVITSNVQWKTFQVSHLLLATPWQLAPCAILQEIYLFANEGENHTNNVKQLEEMKKGTEDTDRRRLGA